MNKDGTKRIRISSTIFLLSLIFTACVTTPTPTVDELSNIQVQPTEAIETVVRREEFPVPNCEGSRDVTRELSSQTSVRKSVTIGSKASVGGGGEVNVPIAAKVRLEAAVEQAYQQVYETAVARIDKYVMPAAPGTHVVYVIKWEEQKFESIVSYDIRGENHQAPYTFMIQVPDMDRNYRVPCPTTDLPTNTPTPTEIIPTDSPTDTPAPSEIMPTDSPTDTQTPTEIVPTSTSTEAQVPLRIISIQGNARIKDDESWPMSDEYGDLSIPLQAVTLSPLTRHPLQFEKCVGGEVRIEIHLDVYLKEDLTAEIKIDARLYEGTSCSTDDQEDTVSQVVYARPDGSTAAWSYTLRNTENQGGDWATINLVFTNNTP